MPGGGEGRFDSLLGNGPTVCFSCQQELVEEPRCEACMICMDTTQAAFAAPMHCWRMCQLGLAADSRLEKLFGHATDWAVQRCVGSHSKAGEVSGPASKGVHLPIYKTVTTSHQFEWTSWPSWQKMCRHPSPQRRQLGGISNDRRTIAHHQPQPLTTVQGATRVQPVLWTCHLRCSTQSGVGQGSQLRARE